VFSLYILYSQTFDRFYIGSTDNLARRLQDHNAGNTPSTRPFRPWKIIYSESFSTLQEARSRERHIKSWKSRNYMISTLEIKL
jgi:putative endonuclease